MAQRDSRGMLYVGLGALAAVGAGYLVWRFVLSDETKDRAKAVARSALQRGTSAAQEMAAEVSAAGHEAANGASAQVARARRSLAK